MNLQKHYERLKKKIMFQCNINSAADYTQGSFESLAQKINEKLSSLSKLQQEQLGTTISVSTLERVFKTPNYKIAATLDKRKLNTLDKLAIFAGYACWDDFVQKEEEETILEVVRKGVEAEMNAYRQLPTIVTSEIDKYFCEKGGARMKIYNILVQNNIKKWTLNTPHNPSSFEFYNIWIEKIEGDTAIVVTEEYFYLRWHDVVDGQLRYTYNEKNEQKYKLQKIMDIWKIVSNYYPPPNNLTND